MSEESQAVMHEGATIITGAGSGLGRALAKRLAVHGRRLALVGRRRERLQLVQDECVSLGARREDCGIYPLDVTCRDSAAATISQIEAHFGGISALINNAALARFSPLESARLDDWNEMLRTNLLGPALLTGLASGSLRKASGVVINVGSIGGTLALPGRALYGASKAALAHLTRSLARELAPRVRVNAVIPGAIDTEMYADLGMSDSEVLRLKKELVRTTPLGRMGTVDDVAPWVELLLGPAGSWVTGSLMVIDGGRSC